MRLRKRASILRPAFKGPFPFAFSAISLLALASSNAQISLLCISGHRGSRTGLLLLPECQIILIQLLLLLLWGFKRLSFAAYIDLDCKHIHLSGGIEEWAYLLYYFHP